MFIFLTHFVLCRFYLEFKITKRLFLFHVIVVLGANNYGGCCIFCTFCLKKTYWSLLITHLVNQAPDPVYRYSILFHRHCLGYSQPPVNNTHQNYINYYIYINITSNFQMFHWFECSFIISGWLGLGLTGITAIAKVSSHTGGYAGKILKFYSRVHFDDVTIPFSFSTESRH